VEFAPVPEWLRIEPASGVVPVFGHTDLDIVFTSAGLGPGDFHAVLEVYTNDPAHETLGVDAVLHAALVPLDRFVIRPRTVNRAPGLGSIRMNLQLPPGLDPHEVLLPSVTVNGSPLPEGVQVSFHDENGDGTEELILRLNRQSFLVILGASDIVTVIGEVRETTWFTGTSSVRIIMASGDLDLDGIGDTLDNCPLIFNPAQPDIDDDDEGDVCDLDDGELLFTDLGPTLVQWQAETVYDTFNLYRGDTSLIATEGYAQDPVGVQNADRFCGELNSFMLDSFVPPLGSTVHYLVTGVVGGIESSLGRDWLGMERPGTWACP
jgi:hypothetical protein